MKPSGLLRSVFTFGSWTLASRVLGLARDVVIGIVFGPSAATDAFFVAFKIPNFMRRLFAEGAFAQAFVPVLSEWKSQCSAGETRQLIARVSGSLSLVLMALTVLGVIGAPLVVSVFAPGFANDPTRYALAVEMLRWTFPYLLLISLTACAGAVLNAWGSFGPPAFAPVLLNLCMITAAWWLAPRMEPGIMALAIAVLVAGVLQLLLQLPFLRRRAVLVWPRPGFGHPGVSRILRLMGPTLFGTSVQQVNLLVDTILASFLATGSISWLYWSDRLVEFPLGIFGVAIGTVILPRLSGQHAEGSAAEFSATLDWALRLTVVIIVPATVGLVALAAPMISTLFQYGAFGATDVMAASMSLMTYSLGLMGFVLVKVLTPAFFSRQDTGTPVRCAATAMVVNMALSTSLVWLLLHSGIAHAGLAFATAAAATENALMLYISLRRSGRYLPRPGWRRLGRIVGLGTLGMAAVLYWPASHPGLWLDGGGLHRVLYLTAAIGAGAAVYGGILLGCGLRPRELREPVPDAAEHG